MGEPLLLGSVLVCLLSVAIARLASANRIQSRALARLEAKLDAVLKHQGIRFDPYSDLPPPVIEALRRGRKIEAIKEYRVATGAGLKDAKDYVDEVERRVLPRA